MQFLLASGLPEKDARMAMPAAGRYTVGSVLEEQADTALVVEADHPVVPTIDNESAFEAGPAPMVDGLAQRVGTWQQDPHRAPPRARRRCIQPSRCDPYAVATVNSGQ